LLKNMSIAEFGRVLASSSPAPGGGSVAALSGMVSANLVSMVCRLTIGKQGYEAHSDEASEVLAQAESLSESLLNRIDLDTEAFTGVMTAFKMPKESADQKTARTEAIQRGYKSAIQSPLGIAHECLRVLQLAARLLGKSNANTLSDLGVAGQQAFAGLEGALMNVKINLPSIKDEGFVRAAARDVATLLHDGQVVSRRIYAEVSRGLGG
jgi:methenyltetrahydrofolate cyclohydrolase